MVSFLGGMTSLDHREQLRIVEIMCLKENNNNYNNNDNKIFKK